MKRTQLRELLVGSGVENPSKEIIDTLLDAFNEETKTLKDDYETKLNDATTKQVEFENKIKDLESKQVSNDELETYKKENELLKSQIKKSNRESILNKYGIDKDFYESALAKISEGKDDAEWETNVKAFAESEDNKKYLVNKTKVINTNPTPDGKTPKPEENLRDAIAAAYKTK